MTEFLRRRLVLIALVLVNIPWIIGYAVLDDLRDADQAQIERNSAENDCQTAYAVALTDALEDRDAVTTLARASTRDLWRTFRDLLVNPLPGDQGRERFLEALDDYFRTSKAIDRAADINPYPDLAECFEALDDAAAMELRVRLASAAASGRLGRCLGRPVTVHDDGHIIVGTNGPDVIRGTGRGDLISSGRGKDRICAGRGGDVINAGQGFDRVNCGKGIDIVQAEERKRNCEVGREG